MEKGDLLSSDTLGEIFTRMEHSASRGLPWPWRHRAPRTAGRCVRRWRWRSARSPRRPPTGWRGGRWPSAGGSPRPRGPAGQPPPPPHPLLRERWCILRFKPFERGVHICCDWWGGEKMKGGEICRLASLWFSHLATPNRLLK